MTAIAVTLKDVRKHASTHNGGVGVYEKDQFGNWELMEYLDPNSRRYPGDMPLVVAGHKGGKNDMEEAVNEDKTVFFKFTKEFNLPHWIMCH